MTFARRMQRMEGASSFDVLHRAQALEATGKSIIHLEIGEPEMATPEFIRRAAAEALEQGWTHYGPAAGLPELRHAIATAWHAERGIQCEAANVVVTPGAKPILFFAMMALIDAGDEVIVPDPGFGTYAAAAQLAGATVVPIRLREATGFELDVDELERLVTPRTKLLVLNSPHNPTGAVMAPATVERVAGLALRHDLHVLSDEIYARIQYEGRHLSIAALPGMAERTVVVDGFSKSYAMTGWRLGFGIMEKRLAREVTRLMTHSNSCTASFVQRAGLAALTGPQTERLAMVEEFRRRRDLLIELLSAIPGVRCTRPGGAFYVFPNVSGTGLTSAQLADRLLEDAGVACLAGTIFGPGGEGFVRLSAANSIDNLRAGVERMSGLLSAIARD